MFPGQSGSVGAEHAQIDIAARLEEVLGADPGDKDFTVVVDRDIGRVLSFGQRLVDSRLHGIVAAQNGRPDGTPVGDDEVVVRGVLAAADHIGVGEGPVEDVGRTAREILRPGDGETPRGLVVVDAVRLVGVDHRRGPRDDELLADIPHLAGRVLRDRHLNHTSEDHVVVTGPLTPGDQVLPLLIDVGDLGFVDIDVVFGGGQEDVVHQQFGGRCAPFLIEAGVDRVAVAALTAPDHTVAVAVQTVDRRINLAADRVGIRRFDRLGGNPGRRRGEPAEDDVVFKRLIIVVIVVVGGVIVIGRGGRLLFALRHQGIQPLRHDDERTVAEGDDSRIGRQVGQHAVRIGIGGLTAAAAIAAATAGLILPVAGDDLKVDRERGAGVAVVVPVELVVRQVGHRIGQCQFVVPLGERLFELDHQLVLVRDILVVIGVIVLLAAAAGVQAVVDPLDRTVGGTVFEQGPVRVVDDALTDVRLTLRVPRRIVEGNDMGGIFPQTGFDVVVDVLDELRGEHQLVERVDQRLRPVIVPEGLGASHQRDIGVRIIVLTVLMTVGRVDRGHIGRNVVVGQRDRPVDDTRVVPFPDPLVRVFVVLPSLDRRAVVGIGPNKDHITGSVQRDRASLLVVEIASADVAAFRIVEVFPIEVGRQFIDAELRTDGTVLDIDPGETGDPHRLGIVFGDSVERIVGDDHLFVLTGVVVSADGTGVIRTGVIRTGVIRTGVGTGSGIDDRLSQAVEISHQEDHVVGRIDEPLGVHRR